MNRVSGNYVCVLTLDVLPATIDVLGVVQDTERESIDEEINPSKRERRREAEYD